MVRDRIMKAVGFEHPTAYYDGNQNCRHIRLQAARLLPEVLADLGYELDQPLLSTVRLVASEGESDPYTVWATWDAVYKTIDSHIRATGMDKASRNKLFQAVQDDLVAHYLPHLYRRF